MQHHAEWARILAPKTPYLTSDNVRYVKLMAKIKLFYGAEIAGRETSFRHVVRLNGPDEPNGTVVDHIS